jgi:hypothetical protein
VHCIVNCWLHKSVFSWAVCPLRMPSTLPLLAACMQTDVIDCQIPLTLITSLADESGSSPRCYLQERWRNNATVWINFQAPEAWLQFLAISKATCVTRDAESTCYDCKCCEKKQCKRSSDNHCLYPTSCPHWYVWPPTWQSRVCLQFHCSVM